jgi:two-component system, phosphorelay protein LuxU
MEIKMEPNFFRPEQVASMVGQEFIGEMLENYVAGLSNGLLELTSAWQHQDSQRVHSLSHKLKSSARFVGADQFSQMLQTLEHDTSGQNNITFSDRSRLDVLAAQGYSVIAEINAYLHAQSR